MNYSLIYLLHEHRYKLLHQPHINVEWTSLHHSLFSRRPYGNEHPVRPEYVFHLYEHHSFLHNDDTVGKRSSKFWIYSIFKYTFSPAKKLFMNRSCHYITRCEIMIWMYIHHKTLPFSIYKDSSFTTDSFRNEATASSARV